MRNKAEIAQTRVEHVMGTGVIEWHYHDGIPDY
jgi:hypothetical protein